MSMVIEPLALILSFLNYFYIALLVDFFRCVDRFVVDKVWNIPAKQSLLIVLVRTI